MDTLIPPAGKPTSSVIIVDSQREHCRSRCFVLAMSGSFYNNSPMDLMSIARFNRVPKIYTVQYWVKAESLAADMSNSVQALVTYDKNIKSKVRMPDASELETLKTRQSRAEKDIKSHISALHDHMELITTPELLLSLGEKRFSYHVVGHSVALQPGTVYHSRKVMLTFFLIGSPVWQITKYMLKACLWPSLAAKRKGVSVTERITAEKTIAAIYGDDIADTEAEDDKATMVILAAMRNLIAHASLISGKQVEKFAKNLQAKKAAREKNGKAIEQTDFWSGKEEWVRLPHVNYD